MVINLEQMVLSLAPKCSPPQPLLFITSIPRALRTAPKFHATRRVMNDQGCGWELLSDCGAQPGAPFSFWGTWVMAAGTGRSLCSPGKCSPLATAGAPSPGQGEGSGGPAGGKEPAKGGEGRSRVQQSL